MAMVRFGRVEYTRRVGPRIRIKGTPKRKGRKIALGR